MISAALLDGQVGPAQLIEERVQAPDARAIVARIECRPDAPLTARFPQELSARITVRTKDGRELVVEHIGYKGGLDKPMSWERTVEKFHWLSETRRRTPRQNHRCCPEDRCPVAQLRPTAVYPITHPGI